MCRATFKTVAKFIGILSILFSFFVQAATPEQIEMIQSAAECHTFETIDQLKVVNSLLMQQILTQE